MKAFVQPLRALTALGFALAVVGAYAANGFSVTPEEEKLIKVGMTRAEVRAAIGRPSHTVRYRNQNGPTWVYSVNGASYVNTVFDVDFDENGKVLSMGEIVNRGQGQPGYEGD